MRVRREFGVGRWRRGRMPPGPDRPAATKRRRDSDEQPLAANPPDMRRVGELPLGIVRWRARTLARRREIERQLFDAPLNAVRREALQRWLRNLEGREAWQAARLEHTVALKQLLRQALDSGSDPPAGRQRPRRDEADRRRRVDSLYEETKDR